jgi:WD40 repeat protein
MRSRLQYIPDLQNNGPLGRPEAVREFQAVRLPLLSRQVLLLIILFLVGSLVAGIVSEEFSRQTASSSLAGHDALVESVIYSPDGRTLFSCGWDNTVRAWNVEDGSADWGKEVSRLSHPSHVFSVAQTPDLRYLAIGGIENLTIWSRGANGGWEKLLQSSGSAHRGVAASPDSRTLAVGGADGSIQLWDLPSLRQKAVLPGLSDEVHDLAFSTDGSILVGSAFDRRLRVWSVGDGQSRQPLPIDCGSAIAFALHPREPVLATSHGEGPFSKLSLWDLTSGREMWRLKGCEIGNNVLAFSRDGRLLASGDKDNKIRLYDGITGKLLTTLDDELGWVKTLAFSPDDRQIAFAGRDGIVRFRKVPEEAAGR